MRCGGLRLADDGRLADAAYDPEFFAQLVRAEDRHFWFRHRNKLLAAVLEPVVRNLKVPYRVLEVGCGTGNTLRVLEQVCRGAALTGTDPFEEALAIARGRVRCKLVRADVAHLDLPGTFELMAAFDVLEHIDDDIAAVRRLRSKSADGGRLMVTVPAHQHLWSYADDAAYHYRRYSAGQLRTALESAGYVVEYLTPFMSWVYPLMWAKRRLASAAGRTHRDAFALTLQDLRIVPGVNGVLLSLLAMELPLVRRRRILPVGTSLLAIARAA
jgi:SAM-dependent methyltransferase